MGASSSEFRTPCAAMSARRPSQSQRLLGSGTPHMSCCSCPRLTGDPAYVSYGPAPRDALHITSRIWQLSEYSKLLTRSALDMSPTFNMQESMLLHRIKRRSACTVCARLEAPRLCATACWG